MSLLNTTPMPLTPAELIADAFRQHARQTYKQLIQTFNGTAQEFWRNPQCPPQEIAAALGEDAVEVFQLHGQIGALLAAVNPEMIAEGLAVVGEFTYNEDGTITIATTPVTTPDAYPESIPPTVE